MSLYTSLAVGAFLVASVHMAAPDHWVPITLVAEREHYTSLRKYASVASIGALHATTTIGISAAALFATRILFPFKTGLVTDASALIMFAVGSYFIIQTYRSQGDEPIAATYAGILSVSIFPDLTFLPILLSSISLSAIDQVTITTEFMIVTILSLVAIVAFVSPMLSRAMKKMPEKSMDYMVGIILIVLGFFVLVV